MLLINDSLFALADDDVTSYLQVGTQKIVVITYKQINDGGIQIWPLMLYRKEVFEDYCTSFLYSSNKDKEIDSVLPSAGRLGGTSTPPDNQISLGR